MELTVDPTDPLPPYEQVRRRLHDLITAGALADDERLPPVRQLAGVLFRAALQCNGSSLVAEHFPHIAIQSGYSGRRTDFAPELSKSRSDEAIAGAPGVTLYTGDGHLRPLEEIEADIIRLAIGHYRGRMTEVARRLGIGRSTLYRKLGDLGIDTAA